MYWTAHTPRGNATLCERCALLAVNMATLGMVRRPFDTVFDAVVAINAKALASGLPTLELPCSDYGVCGNCGEDKFEPVSA